MLNNINLNCGTGAIGMFEELYQYLRHLLLSHALFSREHNIGTGKYSSGNNNIIHIAISRGSSCIGKVFEPRQLRNCVTVWLYGEGY